MAVYGKKAQIERFGVSGEEGYKKERESLEKGMDKQLKRNPEATKKFIDAEMTFRRTQDIEAHMEEINKGRGNGIPDNNKKRVK